MKQRPETLFSSYIPKGCLLYGNNPSIEDYIVLDLLPHRLNAAGVEIKSFTETELLAVSKEKLYLESSLFDVTKLYIVREVTDKFLALLQSYQAEVPIVLVGKNLKTSSKIVSYVVNHSTYQAAAIYGDDSEILTAFILHELKAYQKEPGVEGFILNHLDTFASVRQQVNVLKQVFSNEKVLTLSAVEKILIPSQSISIFKVAEAVVSKNPRAMVDIFQKAHVIFEKEMIPLLRIIAKQFWDLLLIRRQIDQGQNAQQVVAGAKPLIPFNRRPQIIHNLSKWTAKGLLNAIVLLDELEVLIKQPQSFSTDLIERNFLQMSKL
ncbi:MAG: hypothetical protein H6492_03140 [Candidatus Paracaedibacteraceae bacterium]|nr:hypothetical protein [Candidatus Paracaedibacteraceae bacterium]